MKRDVRVITLSVLFALFVFCMLEYIVSGFEIGIIKAVQGLENVFLDAFFRVVTVLGETDFILVVLALLLLFCGARVCGKYAFVIGITAGIGQIIKAVVRRARPFEFAPEEVAAKTGADGYSFASGHMLAVTVTAVFLICVVFERVRSRGIRAAAVVLCSIAAAAVGFSRIYLGVHYLSDVAAAAVIGAALAFGLGFTFDYIFRKLGYSFGLKDTKAIAKRFCRVVDKGTAVLLCGGMGAGKTTFVSFAVKKLLKGAAVSSPTFTVINSYGNNIFHADLYRIANERELENTGFYELCSGENVVFVEWPERCSTDKIKADVIGVRIEVLLDNVRRITWGRDA